MEIFNTHSHINDKIDSSKELMEECHQKNVENVIAVGIDFETSENALKIAHMYDNVYAACGLQPEEVYKYKGDINEFKKLFDDPRCVCIGEIGLDYHFGKENREDQMFYFEEQLKIAASYKKPIEIHCRDAHEDTYNLLAKYSNQLDGIILHCYSGSVEMMERYVKIGAYISFSGVVTFKNAKVSKEVAVACPIDRILVETDDPYLAPHPFRGQENHPAYVYRVVEELATLKQISVEEMARITTENAKRVFHL